MKVTGLPTKLSKTAYDVAVADFVSVAAMRDVEAVYLAGTASHPGISDLDFLLILADHPTGGIRRLEDMLPQSVKRLIGRGTILKVPARYAHKICCIDDFPLTHVYGREFAFADYNSRPFEICRVLDWLPERIWTLNRNLHNDSLHAVYSLQLAKSLGVSFQKADAVMGSNSSQGYIAQVQDVRQRWFYDSATPDQLEQLLRDGIERGRAMLDAFVSYLHDQQILMPPPSSATGGMQFNIPSGPQFRFGYATTPQPDALTVPATLATFWGWQAQCGDGYIPGRLRECFTGEADAVSWDAYMSPDVSKAIAERIIYVTCVAEYLRENKLTGLMKYGWFLR